MCNCSCRCRISWVKEGTCRLLLVQLLLSVLVAAHLAHADLKLIGKAQALQGRPATLNVI